MTGDPSTTLVFGAPRTPETYSEFQGGYANSVTSSGYAVAFDVEWSAPAAGDYLVVSGESSEDRVQEAEIVLGDKIGGRSEALDQRDGAGMGFGALEFGLLDQKCRYDPVDDLQHKKASGARLIKK